MGLLLKTAKGAVYYSKDEAFELAFGVGAEVENLPIFLTDEQFAEVEKMAQSKLDSKLFTFYRGKRQGNLLGYAVIDSHAVRTQQETLMIVLSPTGDLIKTEVLAFHEPPEYQPPARWFERLNHRSLENMVLNHGIDAMSGATISCRSAVDSIRKVMAMYRVTIQQGGN
jgi:hypothetical protein